MTFIVGKFYRINGVECVFVGRYFHDQPLFALLDVEFNSTGNPVEVVFVPIEHVVGL